ncbi:MAG: cation transporter [Ruminococcus sp.]|nr:cation transporter [Ruminococcus sp.]
MIEFLVKHLIVDYTQVENPSVRKAYGTLSSIIGIICNIFLFILKYSMGILSGSIAILSDAFNNLSDCANCGITFLGYKFASKPADKNHPFGHGRIEYLTALLIAVVIALMGFSLFKESIDKIRNPEEITFKWIILISLLFSICVKLFMAYFNKKLGKSVKSSVILAAAKDSFNDVIATISTIIALIASLFIDFPIDGIIGLAVSFLILKSSYDIIKDTIDDLLGKPADSVLVDSVCKLICSYDKIIDVHDFVIHNYGPSNMIGSCHVEVSSNENFVTIHDIVDRIEHQIQSQFHIHMTIHMDPIETDNEQVNSSKKVIEMIIKNIDIRLKIHDFRMVTGDTHNNLIFDLVVPCDCMYTNHQLKTIIDTDLKKEYGLYYTIITFDREYIATEDV